MDRRRRVRLETRLTERSAERKPRCRAGKQRIAPPASSTSGLRPSSSALDVIAAVGPGRFIAVSFALAFGLGVAFALVGALLIYLYLLFAGEHAAVSASTTGEGLAGS